jgi:hypothetical protein
MASATPPLNVLVTADRHLLDQHAPELHMHAISLIVVRRPESALRRVSAIAAEILIVEAGQMREVGF